MHACKATSTSAPFEFAEMLKLYIANVSWLGETLTIDDELILELIRPDSEGRITGEGLIVAITGTKDILYKLEESTHYLKN